MIPPYNLSKLDDAITRLPSDIGGQTVRYRRSNLDVQWGPYVFATIDPRDTDNPDGPFWFARHAIDDRIVDFDSAFHESMCGLVITVFQKAGLVLDPVYEAFGHPVPQAHAAGDD